LSKRILVINADDFGFSADMNSAIERLHRAGRVSNATLMVYGKAVEDALSIIRRNPGLSVGLHLDLCEVMGFYQMTYAEMREKLKKGPEMVKKVAEEVDRQVGAFKALGLNFTHMDGHRHFHALPEVFPTVVQVAVDHGLKSLRLTKDWILPRTPSLYWDEDYLLYARDLLRAHGVLYPDRFVLGWKEYSFSDFRDGINELMVHVGEQDEAYRREYDLLRSPEFRDGLKEVTLKSYRQLAEDATRG
jgi:predicted glycoside hydrolase/deacetylase ChbG (UPF0249 family)